MELQGIPMTLRLLIQIDFLFHFILLSFSLTDKETKGFNSLIFL